MSFLQLADDTDPNTDSADVVFNAIIIIKCCITRNIAIVPYSPDINHGMFCSCLPLVEEVVSFSSTGATLTESMLHKTQSLRLPINPEAKEAHQILKSVLAGLKSIQCVSYVTLGD